MNKTKSIDKFMTVLETLYIINLQSAFYSSGNTPYRYRDGKEMTTRDVIRYESMKLGDIRNSEGDRRLLTVRAANKRLLGLLKYKTDKKLTPMIVESKRSYKAYSSNKRIIYELTTEGHKFLNLHIKELNEFYGSVINTLGEFPVIDKKEFMPNIVNMIHY